MCSVSALIRSSQPGGKHPHSVYSHCNERMLHIMKEEDGSSLTRTHPHITRSVCKGLVVIVASPACALSPPSLIPLINLPAKHAHMLLIYTRTELYSLCGLKSGALASSNKPDIMLVLATY
ncbi:hypothetical protein ILYODFUR_027043 [Ilyodon furcidens]|uniref:Uncharacterized protein n=1 Tax=Ilyodon furcidens TaxID=33524 RepID=A0ABV0T0Y8_9TELE